MRTQYPLPHGPPLHPIPPTPPATGTVNGSALENEFGKNMSEVQQDKADTVAEYDKILATKYEIRNNLQTEISSLESSLSGAQSTIATAEYQVRVEGQGQGQGWWGLCGWGRAVGLAGGCEGPGGGGGGVWAVLC